METRNLAREYLQRVAAGLEGRGVPVRVRTVEGRVPRAILDFVEKNQVNLTVVATRGLSGPSRWLMGSVADRVVRGTRVPVLL